MHSPSPALYIRTVAPPGGTTIRSAEPAIAHLRPGPSIVRPARLRLGAVPFGVVPRCRAVRPAQVGDLPLEAAAAGNVLGDTVPGRPGLQGDHERAAPLEPAIRPAPA